VSAEALVHRLNDEVFKLCFSFVQISNFTHARPKNEEAVG
jgi:hypothetical protein